MSGLVIPDARSAIRNPGGHKAVLLPLGSGLNASHCPGMTKKLEWVR